MGGEAYLTDGKKRKSTILNKNNKTITINSGQFALLLTDESLNIPNDILGFISIKAGIKFKGIINVSGSHVDPGFKGQLLFSVYNAGPARITLKKGEPYFLIFFTELSESLGEGEVYNKEENHHQGQNDIPTKYLDALKSGDLASPSSLSKRINKLNNTFKIIIVATTFLISAALAICLYFYSQNTKYE